MTTPQRYSEPDETRSYMRRDGLGPWIRFTDHEADKAQAVEELKELYKGACAAEDVLIKTLSSAESTIARLTKALKRASELLEEVRTGEDFEVVCWEAAEEFKQILKKPTP